MFGVIIRLSSLTRSSNQKRQISNSRAKLFGVQIICIPCAVFEICMSEKKEKRRKMMNKSKFSCLIFLDCEKDKWNSGGTFYIRIPKGFHL